VTNKRVAYVVNHAAFFVSHRLPLALGARQIGFEACLFCGQAGSAEMENFAVRALNNCNVPLRRAFFTSSGTNPLIELVGLLQLIWFIARFKPDIVHCASPKGVLYGGIAARLCGVPALVLAISGMGYAYTTSSTQNGARAWVRRIYSLLARFAFRHPCLRVIVQNRDDYQSALERGLATQGSLILIPGSGVDPSRYADQPASEKEEIVLLPARMLRDKGVVEFVEAARQVKRLQPAWRFILAGAANYENPSAIAKDRLLAWQGEGVVEWLGHVEDMDELYRRAAIVCLPSYREGMPKCLLEASAAGCAVLTTDVPGCREAIEPGVTGDMVPARDYKSLTMALASLIEDQERRLNYGIHGRKRAESHFGINTVIHKTLDIYRALLSDEPIQ
jgi:glycosyltransferase involved in cell wall biosynthesis